MNPLEEFLGWNDLEENGRKMCDLKKGDFLID